MKKELTPFGVGSFSFHLQRSSPKSFPMKSENVLGAAIKRALRAGFKMQKVLPL